MEYDLIALVEYTFTDIKNYLIKFGDLSNNIMNNMKNKAIEILFEVIKQKEGLSNDLIEKVKKVYGVKEHLIFTNYISEKEESD